jgi:GntR family transcriptional regulator
VFDDRSPIYHQIADQIETDILHGVTKEGEQVMSTNQYAAEYRINPATAAKAFQRLVDDGILHKQRGIGMFVSAGARSKLQSRRRGRFFADVVEPIVSEARVIGVPLEEVIDRLQSMLGKDDE